MLLDSKVDRCPGSTTSCIAATVARDLGGGEPRDHHGAGLQRLVGQPEQAHAQAPRRARARGRRRDDLAALDEDLAVERDGGRRAGIQQRLLRAGGRLPASSRWSSPPRSCRRAGRRSPRPPSGCRSRCGRRRCGGRRTCRPPAPAGAARGPAAARAGSKPSSATSTVGPAYQGVRAAALGDAVALAGGDRDHRARPHAEIGEIGGDLALDGAEGRLSSKSTRSILFTTTVDLLHARAGAAGSRAGGSGRARPRRRRSAAARRRPAPRR